MAGKPRKFKSGKELIMLWREFCQEIIENNYCKAPTQTEFCWWLERKYDGATRRTIYTSLNEYFPSTKKEFEDIRADIITQGTMLGKYQPSMSIFALKNWCNWKDKSEVDAGEETRKALSERLSLTEKKAALDEIMEELAEK